MGCVANRSSAEEVTIESKSVLTGFERHSVDAVVGAIRSHSTAKLILPAQFQAIKKALKLNAEEKDQAVLQEFYKKFITANSQAREQIEAVHSRVSVEHLDSAALLEEEKLLAAAILLSTGAPRDKALALYRLYDEGFSNALTQPVLTELLRTIFELASEDLIALAKLTETDEVKKYITKAQQNYEKGIAAALALFHKDPPLTPEAFATTLIGYKNGQLTLPSGLRMFLVDQTPKPAGDKLVGVAGEKVTAAGEKLAVAVGEKLGKASPKEEAKAAPHEEAKKPSA